MTIRWPMGGPPSTPRARRADPADDGTRKTLADGPADRQRATISPYHFRQRRNFRIDRRVTAGGKPSAEVQGHGGPKQLIAGRRMVAIIGAERVGNYAVRLQFDDLHDTGIYSWAYLHRLGREGAALWTTYLEKLDAAGLSRDP